MKLQNLFIAASILFTTTVINAQTNEDSHTLTIGIPEVALLDIKSGTTTTNDITLNATAPSVAGNAVTFNQTDSSLWINYSSIISAKNTSRAVAVSITGGTVPLGTELTVQAGTCSEGGEGTYGTVANAAVVLTGTPMSIISGIGSTYTGNGTGKGHNLTYRIQQSSLAGSYAQLNFDQSTTLTITYTLSDIN